MLSLAFAPSTIELGRRTGVDLVLSNTGDGDLYSVRLVARFPSWIRASAGQRRIEISRIEAGSHAVWPFVLIADRVGAVDENLISFPVVSYRDGSGPATKRTAEVGLLVVAGGRPRSQVSVEVRFEDGPVVGRWGRVRFELATADVAGDTTLDLRIGGAEYVGPERVTVESSSVMLVDGSIRFDASGAVPLEVEVTGTTSDGEYVEAGIQEFVTVSDPSTSTGDQHTYNIGKVEGNVGPDGTFTQNNIGGVVGRSSTDSVGQANPALLAEIRQLLSMDEVAGEEHRDDRSTIEAYVKGEAEPKDARSALRRILDRSNSLRHTLLAAGLVEVIEFAAGSV